MNTAVQRTAVDPASEMLALSSCGNNKSLLIAAAETDGPFDVEAGRFAVRKAVTRFPHLGGTLAEVRRNGRFELRVQGSSDPMIPVFTSDVPAELVQLPAPESFVNCLAHRLDREWDLFREPPAEIHFLRFSEKRHMIVLVVHHMAGDAATVSAFGKELLLGYHEIVKGEPHEEANAVHAGFNRGRGAARSRTREHGDVAACVAETLRQFTDRPSRPLGNGEPGDTRQFHIKRLFTTEETGKLRRQWLSKGAFFVDHLAAGASLAIDRWNEMRGISPGVIATTVSVDLRGRSCRLTGPNRSSLVFFRSSPAERMDHAVFTRRLAVAKINQMRNLRDLRYIDDLSRLSSSLSLFPFRVRRRIVDFVNRRRKASLFIVTLGTLWPALKKGRSTAESGLTRAGDLTIREVHAAGYKLCANATPQFMAYFFRGRLNLVFAAGACHLTRAEAEAFMDLAVEQLFR